MLLLLSNSSINYSNDETIFPHKLLLINTQVLWLHKVFAYGSSTNTKLFKPQLSNAIQLGKFLLTPFIILGGLIIFISPPEVTKKKDKEKKQVKKLEKNTL